MRYDEFLIELEFIAIHNGLRLCMNRAPVGCGINFAFKNDLTGEYSDVVVYLPGKQTPEFLFTRLETLAEKFKKGA